MPEEQKKSTASFSDNSTDIISEILSLHKLETQEEFVEKIEKGKKTYGEEITDILKQMASKKLTNGEISKELKTRLHIKQAKADKIVQEIKKKLFTTEAPSKTTTNKPKILPKKEQRKTQRVGNDTYRESVE